MYSRLGQGGSALAGAFLLFFTGTGNGIHRLPYPPFVWPQGPGCAIIFYIWQLVVMERDFALGGALEDCWSRG